MDIIDGPHGKYIFLVSVKVYSKAINQASNTYAAFFFAVGWKKLLKQVWMDWRRPRVLESFFNCKQLVASR